MDDKKYNNLLKLAALTAVEAGSIVMSHFNNKQKKVRLKWDFSPVTIADKEASSYIIEKLASTGIDIISEEEKIPGYIVRRHWNELWIIDPIDGTKEYINGGSDFTVNIALVVGNVVKIGVIYVPFSGELYYGVIGVGSFKQYLDSHQLSNNDFYAKKFSISPNYKENEIIIVTSRLNFNFKSKRFIKKIEKKIENIKFIQRGSSLKYCLVAEGKANLFLRLSAINEWDTAAGQTIAEASGCIVAGMDGESPILYNKKVMVTPQNLVASSMKIVKKML